MLGGSTGTAVCRPMAADEGEDCFLSENFGENCCWGEGEKLLFFSFCCCCDSERLKINKNRIKLRKNFFIKIKTNSKNSKDIA